MKRIFSRPFFCSSALVALSLGVLSSAAFADNHEGHEARAERASEARSERGAQAREGGDRGAATRLREDRSVRSTLKAGESQWWEIRVPRSMELEIEVDLDRDGMVLCELIDANNVVVDYERVSNDDDCDFERRVDRGTWFVRVTSLESERELPYKIEYDLER